MPDSPTQSDAGQAHDKVDIMPQENGTPATVDVESSSGSVSDSTDSSGPPNQGGGDPLAEPGHVSSRGSAGVGATERPPLPVDVPLHIGIEAIMLVVDEPVSPEVIAGALQAPVASVVSALERLSGEYASQERGFDLRRVAGGWRLYTRPDCAAFVERFILDGQQTRLTQAALETLAVVAYRQPVSRGRVSNIRGVNVDGVMRTLVLRGLVEEAGSDSSTGALLYRTTAYFLERLGLNDVTELPSLAPLLPDIELLELENG